MPDDSSCCPARASLAARHDVLTAAWRRGSSVTRSPSMATCSIITTASAPARHRRTGHDLHALTGSDGRARKSLPALISPTQRNVRTEHRVVGGAQGESIAHGTIERRVVAIGSNGLRQHAAAGARKLDRFRRQRSAQRSNAWRSLFRGLLRRTACAAQLSQDANCVPEATIVASRSGPVEIMPISTFELVGDELEVVERASRQACRRRECPRWRLASRAACDTPGVIVIEILAGGRHFVHAACPCSSSRRTPEFRAAYRRRRAWSRPAS